MFTCNEVDEVIYRMTIRLKDGRVIRRPDGRPFRIVLRKPSKTKGPAK